MSGRVRDLLRILYAQLVFYKWVPSSTNKLYYVSRMAGTSEDTVPCVILDTNGQTYGDTNRIGNISFTNLYIKRVPKDELPTDLKYNGSIHIDPMKNNGLILILLNQEGVFDLPFENNKWLIKFHVQEIPSLKVGLISENKNKTLGLTMSLASVLSENDCALGPF